MKSNLKRSWLPLLVSIFVIFMLSVTTLGFPRGGSFGGGGRSFGGGGFGGGGRSFGGGGFGGSGRSFGGGSFGGGGGRTFGGGSSSSGSSRSFSSPFSRSSSGSSSFNRSGAFGSSGRINSTSVNAPPAYRGMSYSSRGNYFYGGGYHPYYGYGGYGDYWFHPAWYYWMPFHPAFYYNPPYSYGGAYYPGDFSFGRLLLGLIIFTFVIWLLARLFGGGGGGGRVRYTSYR